MLEIKGKILETDDEGYIKSLDDWSPEIAEKMAANDDCELADNHWEVIKLMRSYYEEYKISPTVRVLTREIGKTLGADKGNSRYLYALFPYGPIKQASKYAGLPKPSTCV